MLKTVSADVSSRVGQEVIAEALPENTPLNFLVNNAGVGVPNNLEDISLQDFEQAMAINVCFPRPSPRASGCILPSFWLSQ